jgi:hypothetical protein
MDTTLATGSPTLLPPNIPAASPVTQPAQPEMADSATAGLSGSAPTVGGPAFEGPAQPHVSVARHILDALGGSGGGPMDWAKSVIAGSLAGAANVGKVPEGGGFLYGMAKGAQGQQELQRQKMLDKRQATLDQSKLEDEKIQRQVWNANIAGETQRQQEAAELFKYAPAEHAAKLQELADAHLKFVQEQLAVFQSSGIDLSQYVEVKNQADLTPEQKQGLTSHPPTLMAVPNGEAHDAGQDNAGVHLVPSEVLIGARLKKDMPISIPASDENGNPTTKQITISAGTPAMAAAAILQGAKNQVDTQQKGLLRQTEVQQAINKNRAEELKNQPPPKDQLDTFMGKTLPGYTTFNAQSRTACSKKRKIPARLRSSTRCRSAPFSSKLSAPIERFRNRTSGRTKKRPLRAS